MATFNKFDQFIVDVAAGVHTLTTAGSLLKICLTNTAPVKATDGVLADITQIAYTNLDLTQIDVENVGAETPAGTWDVSGTDKVWTASGAVATFRYVVLYNDTPAAPLDPLIGWWDYGSGITLANLETFTTDFGTSLFTLG